MNNKKIGNRFEQELCDKLYDSGFWSHLLNANKAGQPADIIAVRNKHAHIIDCKVCSDNTFALSRIEENQDTAMDLWRECGNEIGWFALKLDEFSTDIYFISHFVMRVYRKKQSYLSDKEIIELGIPFDKWVMKCK